MTNRELLAAPKPVLSELDRQRQFLLHTEGVPAPCPACKRPTTLFEAAGIDIDAYDFGATQYHLRCPRCTAELEQVIPFIVAGPTPWLWQLKDSWLQEQLRKAKAFDQIQSSGLPSNGK